MNVSVIQMTSLVFKVMDGYDSVMVFDERIGAKNVNTGVLLK